MVYNSGCSHSWFGGQHVAQAFAAKGYKVALASRSLKEETSNADQVHISADLLDPVFDNVERNEHSFEGVEYPD
ncbi:short-chain dehydrogenase [Penicillium atrosanguineum]|nr:short-chain dehydrogenase [Penicillium atrosanguineum]